MKKKLSLIVMFAALIVAGYIMKNGLGLIEGLDFGPGQYYYTDLPGWDKIFFGEKSINIGTRHPLLFFAFFFSWGYFCFKVLQKLG